MMNHDAVPSYGLWGLAILNSVIFVFFAFSFFKPKTKTDWRTFGSFSAFIVALFVEMYGFPLSIYLLSGWLSTRYPQIDFFSHNNGHMIHTLLGLQGDPHFDVFHILSNILIFGGFILLSYSWHALWSTQRRRQLATTGVYHYVRHPQYVAFIIIMLGFLLQWPTLLTLAMFPILVFMYARLAIHEEHEIASKFGDEYRQWAARTGRFFPAIGKQIAQPR